MSSEISSGILQQLSEQIGTTEPAIRLLISVFAGYPIALVHRLYFYGKPACTQHTYFILTSLCLGYFNYGLESLHAVAAILFTYFTMLLMGGTAISVAIVFICTMAHLLTGYYCVGTDSYDINWTMPQCVLVLRLIGLAFDYYDGQQPLESLSKENKKVALLYMPQFLEVLGYTMFPASYMVGPQFPMSRYQKFVEGQYSDRDRPNEPPSSVVPAMRRFGLGMFYLVVFQFLGMFVSDDYMMSEEFGELAFVKKMFLLGVWGRYTLYKYISCWLLTEGACILFGVAYNDTDELGEPLWNGVENIKLAVFENTTEFNHYIQSFNVNTNHWVAQYIYKRLKFLGNRHLSQLGALLFLAIWHGFHSGYYVCFLFEFIVIYMERDFKSIVASNDTLTAFFSSEMVIAVSKVLLRVYTFVFMGWCLLPFALLKFPRYWTAFANVNYAGIVLFVMWPVLYGPILRVVFKKRRRPEGKGDEKVE